MLDTIILLLAVTLVPYGIYKWLTSNHDYFVKRGIPHVKPQIFGNTLGFMFRKYGSYDFMQMLYDQFPNEKIFGLFDIFKPQYFLRDPDTIKQLAVKDFDHFEDHQTFVDEKSDRLFGNSLFMLSGHRWRDMRSTLSPGFTGSKMRQMYDLISECASFMSNYFIENTDETGSIHCEMKEMFGRYSNDVIASAAFGCSVNSFKDQNNDFIVAGKQFLNINKPSTMIKVFLFSIIPSSWLTPFDIQFTSKKISNFFRSMVFGTMEIREKEGIFRPDMINILSNVRKGNYEKNLSNENESVISDSFASVDESNIGKNIVKRKWNDDEIIAQCFLFFIAGFDTTSTFLSFITYELALNVDIQKRLYEEVVEMDRLSNGAVVSYDNLQKMKYLDMVVSETLRRWPPGAFTDRLCVKDYQYDDGNLKFVIEKGQQLWISINALHHDPNNFPDPLKFDPERFNDDNKQNIRPGTYIPFGVGPRNCIGSRFALMQIKTIIYQMVLNFEMKPNEKTQIPLKLQKTPFAILTERGVDLELKRRVTN